MVLVCYMEDAKRTPVMECLSVLVNFTEAITRVLWLHQSYLNIGFTCSRGITSASSYAANIVIVLTIRGENSL